MRDMKRLLISIIAILTVGYSFAQSYLEMAENALDNNDYALVIHYATEHLNSYPKSADAYGMRSLAYASQEDYIQAFDDADKAIKYWNKKCQYDLATLYCLRGLIYEQVQDYDKALENYNLAIKKDKKNPRGYAQRGRFYYKKHDYESAAINYKKAHEMMPNNADYTLEFARNLWLLDLNGQAAEILEELMLYHPRMSEAKRIRALIYREAEDWTSFIDLYADYISMEHNNVDVFISTTPKAYGYMIKTISSYIKNAEDEDTRYFWLGLRSRAYMQMDQYVEALADANSMQALVTDTVPDGYVLLLQSDCYEGLYDYANAARCYDGLIELYPNSEYTYYYYNHRARCFLEMGEYEKAEADFQKVIENDMDYAISAYVGRGRMREEQQNYEGALDDYNKALLLNEDLAFVLLYRGRLYLDLNDVERANIDLDKALELEGEDVSITRAYTLLYKGEGEQALSIMAQIIEEEPSAGNYYDLACMYSLLNRKEEAIRALTVSFEKGFRSFRHMEKDTDLDNIREMPEYKELIQKYNK